MSVQVSYKKQTLLGIIGLIILFLIIELIANVWWYTQISCEFEENEIFQQMDSEKKRQLCVDLYNIQTLGDELLPNQQHDTININSMGFRGSEFSSEKPENTHRIIMLGGSTMFGYGATSDETTIPGYLQELLQNSTNNYVIEVINAGIQGADSFSELNLLKTRLIDYGPDMVIIYDGWNDLRAENSVEFIKNNWKNICELGMNEEFQTVIALQPIAGFGNKILTDQELIYSKTGTNYANVPLIHSLNEYQSYADELYAQNNCTETLDLREVFDTEKSTIYWDQGHVSDIGNSFVAKAIYDKVLHLLPEKISKPAVVSTSLNLDESSIFETEFKYLISGYKTTLMLNSIFSFEINTPSNIKNSVETPEENLFFETQSKKFESSDISINIEIIKTQNTDSEKTVKVNTINQSENLQIPHVTYFLKIFKDDKLLLSDFFYTPEETLTFDVHPNNSESITISGERKYDHNALIADSQSSVLISGPILKDNEIYDFNIELRTIYDPSNWIFSLNNFNVQVTP